MSPTEYVTQQFLFVRSQQTKKLLFITNLLKEPFIALNLMVNVFLVEYYDASTFHTSLLTTLWPVLSVFAFYWGSLLALRPNLLRQSLITATVLAPLFFLLMPATESIWYIIAAQSCFALFSRAMMPAQMEVLKINLPQGQREEIFSQALSISYASSILIGPFLGFILKENFVSWKILFSLLSLLYISSALLKNYFFIPQYPTEELPSVKIKDILLRPWKDSYALLKKNKTFARFQLAFLIAASGLMFAKPCIPQLLKSKELSLFQIFSLFTFLEGLGFISSTRLWARLLTKQGLQKTSSQVLFCFAFHPFLLLFPFFSDSAAFFAYFMYGVAQGGSRLVWYLSGPILCGKESSTPYSSVNILAIGIRGCFVPFLGALFANYFGTYPTLFISLLLMLVGAVYMKNVAHKELESALS